MISYKLLFPFKFLYRKIFLNLLKWLFFKVYKTDPLLIQILDDPEGVFNSVNVSYERYKVKTPDQSDYLTRIRLKSHKHYVNYIRFKTIAGAVLHSPGTTVSLVVSLLSLIIPFFFIFTTTYSTRLLIQLIFGVFLSAVSFFSLVPYLRYYVRQLNLNDYAFFIRNVYTESEMIAFISFRIREICLRFKKSSDWLNEVCEYTLKNGETINVKKFLVCKDEIRPNELKHPDCYFPDIKNEEVYFRGNNYGLSRLNQIKKAFTEDDAIKQNRKKEVPAKIRSLNFTINEMEKDLQQVAILVKYCSERLRIPEVELAEHFFQFSTSMYWSWLKKISHNLDVVADLFYHANFPEKMKSEYSTDLYYDQIKDRLYQIDRFLARNERFMHYQCQNIAFNDLHDDIIDIGSDASSSEPVKIYVRLLSRIHSQTNVTKPTHTNIITTIERLLYVYHKRKIHIGLDLHQSAHTILQKINVTLKKGVRNHVPLKGDFTELTDVFDLRKFQKILKEIQSNPLIYYNKLATLEFLHIAVVIYIDHCRNKMEKEFLKETNDIFKKWMDEIDDKKLPTTKKIHIITFGYSNAVRQIIKNCIINRKVLKYSRLVVFSSEAENKIDSRQIKYHLTEQPEKKARNVLVSTPEFITPLIDKDSKIVVLMGAEVFDKANNTVRTHAYKNCLIDFLNGAMYKISEGAVSLTRVEEFSKNIKVWVCAESYKEYAKLNMLTDLFDDQYENIEVYDASLISKVIHD